MGCPIPLPDCKEGGDSMEYIITFMIVLLAIIIAIKY